MKRSLLLAMLFSSIVAQAQDNCSAVLIQAEDEFSQGHFFGLSSLLNDCLQGNKLSNEEKVRAYKLLTQSYLLTDDPVAAEDNYLKLLAVDPEYVANEVNDPVDIYYLSQKFTTTPKFTQTLASVGFNTAMPRVIARNSPFANSDVRYSESLRVGFQVSTGIDYNFGKNFSLGAELMYSRQSYSGTTAVVFPLAGSGVADERILIERQNWIELPVYLRYIHNVGKIRPFGYAGVSLAYLFRSSAEIVFLNRSSSVEGGQSSVSPVQGPDINITFMRNALNRALILGGGVRYKVSKDFLVLDLRYSAGLTNVVNMDRLYYASRSADDFEMNNEVSQYGYVSDAFRIDRISLSVGWIKPLYQPRKVRNAKVKNVGRKRREK